MFIKLFQVSFFSLHNFLNWSCFVFFSFRLLFLLFNDPFQRAFYLTVIFISFFDFFAHFFLIHSFIFQHGAHKYKYGKLIEDMKNYIVRKNDPFPKHCRSMSHSIQVGNHYCSKHNNNKNESSDGIAFATVMDEKETKKSGKKKDITCFRCKNTGHYSNTCEEELPKTTTEKERHYSIDQKWRQFWQGISIRWSTWIKRRCERDLRDQHPYEQNKNDNLQTMTKKEK